MHYNLETAKIVYPHHHFYVYVVKYDLKSDDVGQI